MPDFSAWLGDGAIGVGTAAERAALAWRRIEDKPSEITLMRETASPQWLAPQTVRLETSNSRDGEGTSPVGIEGQQHLIVYGIRDHATLPDTDIERNDRFWLDGKGYEVRLIITTIGEIQAVAEAVS